MFYADLTFVQFNHGPSRVGSEIISGKEKGKDSGQNVNDRGSNTPGGGNPSSLSEEIETTSPVAARGRFQ